LKLDRDQAFERNSQ